jgi:M penetrans paralogue family 26
MAEDPKSESPFEDPFENQVVKDPFVEEHFGGQSGGNYGGNYGGNAGNQPGAAWSETLPDSTAVLVLGILAIIGSFCYGIVGLILGIIGVAIAGRPEKLYRQNPTKYSQSSYGNLKAGRVCAIVGICLSAVFILALFGFLAFAMRF